MKTTDRHKGITELYDVTPPRQLMNLWYEMRYHPSRFATGKGSRKYVQALANFASNLSTYRECNDIMYRDIAEKCARDALNLAAKYKE